MGLFEDLENLINKVTDMKWGVVVTCTNCDFGNMSYEKIKIENPYALHEEPCPKCGCKTLKDKVLPKDNQ